MSTPTTAEALRHRVRALIAKAASTEFPDEAEALAAKAHELMERYAIDEATLRADARGPQAPIRTPHQTVRGPYATARASLLGAVARSTHCRLILGARVGSDLSCTLVGRADDLEAAWALYAALDLQASRAMLAASAEIARPRAFRHAFLLSYASRIGARLDAARASVRTSADAGGAGWAALVSTHRWVAVDAEVRAQFPRLRTMRASASSGSGLASGAAAADRAALGHTAVGGRRALPEAR